MTIPGFAAEAALVGVRRRYVANASGITGAGARVRPQLVRRPNDDCIPGCICVSPINCPCCNSFPWPPWPFPGTDTVSGIL